MTSYATVFGQSSGDPGAKAWFIMDTTLIVAYIDGRKLKSLSESILKNLDIHESG
jgi:hypothetical protein